MQLKQLKQQKLQMLGIRILFGGVDYKKDCAIVQRPS
jgi:hypothetical protein